MLCSIGFFAIRIINRISWSGNEFLLAWKFLPCRFGGLDNNKPASSNNLEPCG
jgi:hypothetical protein